MEVKDANAALLSNFEVYQLLTDLKQQRKESGKTKQSSGQQNLNTIMYETLKYISKTPCRYQSPETVREFLVAMKDHKLTKKFCLEKKRFPLQLQDSKGFFPLWQWCECLFLKHIILLKLCRVGVKPDRSRNGISWPLVWIALITPLAFKAEKTQYLAASK
ncbi:DNA-directed RNA polymerase III subunit RPC9 isoform X5 [Aphelocoma coerulescens]|uniref:DNA-directed RNA polymerase III subunit RPC9 isoform X5 n=1 Tax=Aphelocoma coerulescens TaxID=39617 RepID=UPI003604FB7C